ncbi:MAG TPA: AMP-binding protein, partial [Cyclobacteriaceae bacterium]|nr:AMP-binding protein [Cyclobacteriaceae bacterium]
DKNAIEFCSRWLQGESIFEFQTSGSTGTPKKISFNRDQMTRSALLTQEALQYSKGDTALVCLDVKFIAGAMMLVRSLITGLNMVIVKPSSDPLELITDTIDFAALVPLQLITTLNRHRKKLDAIKNLIIGGAPLDKSTINRLQGVAGSVYATYGMTETITHIAVQKLNGPDRQDFFQALPGISLHIDSRGCLTVQADHLGPLPVITNDLVTMLSDTQFQWSGRADKVINSGGIKVQPEKIEKIIKDVFEIHKVQNRFFVTGVPDTHLGEKVVIFIEGEIQSALESNLRDELELRLSKYEVPQKILKTSAFIETATQKIDTMATVRGVLTTGIE